MGEEVAGDGDGCFTAEDAEEEGGEADGEGPPLASASPAVVHDEGGNAEDHAHECVAITNPADGHGVCVVDGVEECAEDGYPVDADESAIECAHDKGEEGVPDKVFEVHDPCAVAEDFEIEIVGCRCEGPPECEAYVGCGPPGDEPAITELVVSFEGAVGEDKGIEVVFAFEIFHPFEA